MTRTPIKYIDIPSKSLLLRHHADWPVREDLCWPDDGASVASAVRDVQRHRNDPWEVLQLDPDNKDRQEDFDHTSERTAAVAVAVVVVVAVEAVTVVNVMADGCGEEQVLRTVSVRATANGGDRKHSPDCP